MDSSIYLYKSGVQNLVDNEIIAEDAAQDELGWITQDGKLKLVGGRLLAGADSNTTGQIRGLWFGYCVDGTQVLYRKTETALQYLLNGVWTNIITNLTAGTEASFANYSSIAGSFTFFVTTDGYWKINNAFPQNPINMYNPSANFHGRIIIDKGRTFLWDRNDPGSRDRTGLYGSKIDVQYGNFNTATNEQLATGNGSTKLYTGVLQFKSLDPQANSFGITITAVSAITNAVNPVITSTAHGLSVNDTALLSGLEDAAKDAFPMTGTGTVTLGNDHVTVTGSGTAFTTQLKVGTIILVTATAVPSGATYQATLVVNNIASDTSLSLKFPYQVGTVTASTFIFSNMTQINNVPFKVLSVIDANNIQIVIDTTNYDLYSSGGTLTKAEVLTDNRMGVLSSLSGATGTINYITGAYTAAFANNVENSQLVQATYFWEDSNNGGLTDFRFSADRVAGEGFFLSQDKGGDPIMNVLIGQDGNYYSLKQQRAYQLAISADDTEFTNQIYYENMGIPSLNSGVATEKGIMFINTSNPDKPEMTILQKNLVSSTLIPAVLFSGFKFSLFDFSDSYFDTYERYIVVACKTMGATQNNRILLCNVSDGTVDISPYEARMFAKDDVANFYVGSPITQNVYQIYNGFDDLGQPINNFWIGVADSYGSLKLRAIRWRFIREELKKFRKYRIKGTIATTQSVQVYLSYDDAPFQLIGTILGTGTYVDSDGGSLIGSNFIGQQEIGGGAVTNAYPYFCELKPQKQPKFRKRTVKYVATGIGYFDVQFASDWDLMLFENRLPARFRSKQKVSLDGKQTDQ